MLLLGVMSILASCNSGVRADEGRDAILGVRNLTQDGPPAQFVRGDWPDSHEGARRMVAEGIAELTPYARERGVRLGIMRPALYRAQVRALLSASAELTALDGKVLEFTCEVRDGDRVFGNCAARFQQTFCCIGARFVSGSLQFAFGFASSLSHSCLLLI